MPIFRKRLMIGPYSTRWGFIALASVLTVSGCSRDKEPANPTERRSKISRLRGTPRPDFSGVWQALNEANWNLEGQSARAAMVLQAGVTKGSTVPGASVLALGALGGIPGSLGVVEGGRIPYKPEALARREDNAAHALERDPEVKCMVPGVPRATYMPYPFQITQGTTKMMITYGFSNAGRTIHFDEVEPPLTEYWMGHSVGRWENETLIVTVSHQNDQTWFDRAGNFHGAGMRVTERYTPVSNDHLLYEATIDDPETFMRPWTIKMPLYRRIEDHAQVFEYRCIEMVEELLYGHLRKEQLVRNAEHDYGRLGGRLFVQVARRPSRISDQ
jgi:hypothetical protein